MAWTRREIDTHGKVIYFSYSSITLFLKAQRISQYFAATQKDKEGNVAIDIAMTDDHREYFDNYCRAAFESVGNNFIKVNRKAFLTYTYTSEMSSINVTDYGFVKDTMLSVIDEIIERALIDYVLYKWYEHLGVPGLMEKFHGQFMTAVVAIQNSLEQFLRKLYIYKWEPSIEWTGTVCNQEAVIYENKNIQWTDALCVQSTELTGAIAWTDPLCVQQGSTPNAKWTDMLCVQQDLRQKTIRWNGSLCVQDNMGNKTIRWTDKLCTQRYDYAFKVLWKDSLCAQINVMQKDIKWTESLCEQVGGIDYQIEWGDALCVQFESNTKTIAWTGAMCVQERKAVVSLPIINKRPTL